MALKKSELYSSLWQSCDELRGGMDASQYKDYVLVLLFLKYISDKYAGRPYAAIRISPGASFKDMVALKGNPEIGDLINKRIIAPLAKANERQIAQADFPDFNDPVKLGDGKERVERLTNLIAIFENPALDFSKNRDDGDDILGDAYEYLMRHFATESGKSKGQFYTPAEVSRVIAQILGIRTAKTSASTTVYDPTCGSGSLLLKVAEEAGAPVTLNGQEKDAATTGLARMNMVLHDQPTAVILQGNSLTDPKFRGADTLKTFDYVVANPPFSDKRWSTGLNPQEDPFDRFQLGVPPAKQGDYAYLLHIVRSLKSTGPNGGGKAACILPHGVLFRGGAEAGIRRALVRKGYIEGIIGLPANLFYGTGIPACIVVLDKKDAQARKGIFLIDASGGFMKDGPKNRLRAMDIHRIVDVFSNRRDVPKYARMVSFAEIEKNDFNLNLPRYIDSQTPEDLQDIEGHLRGGIPVADVDALERYWEVCPDLRQALFKKSGPGGRVGGEGERAPGEDGVHVVVRRGYKQTEVGVIPEDWEVRPLAGLVAIHHGFAFRSQYFKDAGLYRLTTPGHFYEAGGFRDVGEKQKFYDGPLPSGYLLNEGDLIVAMTEQADGLLGSAALVPTAETYLHNQRLGKVAMIAPGVSLGFLYRVFNSKAYRAKVRDTAAGTKVKHTSPSKLLEISVPLPPTKAEQEAIAEALSDADTLIESLEQLVAKKRRLKQGAMQEVLTGKKRLPGFRGKWEVKRLGDVVDTDPENLEADTQPSFTFNYIALEDVDSGTLCSYSEQVFRNAPSRARRKLRKNDVLVSTVRPNLLSHLLFSIDGDNWVCSTGFCVVRCKKGVSHPGYLYFHMFAGCAGRQIEALLTGSNYPAINSGDVRALQIPFPEYEGQTAIAAILSDMDAEIAALEAKLTKARQIKQGMMQELLTGRIRLV